MAPGGEGKTNPGGGGGGVKGGRKRKYLPHGKPVRKGAYPLRPGVQGFFITCDGGRERDATREALSLLDSFYEDIVDGTASNEKPKSIPEKPMNKKITFDSGSSDDENEDHTGEKANEDNAAEEFDNGNDVKNGETAPSEPQQEVHDDSGSVDKADEEQVDNADESNPKKPRVEDPPALEQTDQKGSPEKPKEPAIKPKESSEKNIDDLIDEDLKEIGDRKKRLFSSLDTGCNGCIFIQMHKRWGPWSS